MLLQGRHFKPLTIKDNTLMTLMMKIIKIKGNRCYDRMLKKSNIDIDISINAYYRLND